MAHNWYLHCLIVLVLAVLVNGQYYHHSKDYLKQSIQSPTSLKSRPRFNEVHEYAEVAARNTLFEPLVADILEYGGVLDDTLDLNLPTNVSAQCRKDFNELMRNLLEPYAIKMLDAAGKLSSGLLQGNILWHGRFDECRAVKADDTHDFDGRYCLTTLNTHKKDALIPQLQLGVCVPDSCSGQDVDTLIETGILELPLQIFEYYPYTMCTIDPEYSAGAIAALCIFSILGLLIVGGTGLEASKYMKKKICSFSDNNEHCLPLDDDRVTVEPETMVESVNSRTSNEASVDVPDNIQLVSSTTTKPRVDIKKCIEKFLMCFSALNNGEKILSTQSAGPNSHLRALNGIRVISMFWVILGHTHLFTSQYVVGNATFSVDSFFVLSGLLVAYLALKELKAKDGRLNWGLFYFHRYWRLTPVYMLVILMWTTLVPHFSNGPLYFGLYTDIPGQPPNQVKLCKEYWWTNLLYINNLYPRYLNLQCINWSWYLANDMQFYVISPIILYALYRSWKIGFAVISALMTVCFSSNAVISWAYDISPSIVQPTFHNSTVANADDFIYIKPWTRINPYLVGMITGYLLYWLQGRSWKIPKTVAILGWCYAISTGLGIVYGLYGTYNGSYQTQPEAVLYYTVSRTLFSSAVAWVAFACATGCGGPVNVLLSWAVWAPLARLTYCAYLLHPIVIIVYSFSRVIPLHYTDYTMIYIFIGHLVLSYAAAFVMSVCAEAPFMALEKLLLPKKSESNKQRQPRSTLC